MLGHAIETYHAAYVKAHWDSIERDRAREALAELGLGRSTGVARSRSRLGDRRHLSKRKAPVSGAFP
jgi:hypothetical protein